MSKRRVEEEEDKTVEIFKVKKLIKNLSAARGYVDKKIFVSNSRVEMELV